MSSLWSSTISFPDHELGRVPEPGDVLGGWLHIVWYCPVCDRNLTFGFLRARCLAGTRISDLFGICFVTGETDSVVFVHGLFL